MGFFWFGFFWGGGCLLNPVNHLFCKLLMKVAAWMPLVPTEQDCIPVMRGQWFIDGTWTPMEDDESDLIEKEHLMCFRGQQMQDTLENDVVAKTVDSKDGKHVHC